VNRLKGYGLQAEDDRELGLYLLNNNYFRLAGLWRYFQEDPQAGLNQFIQTFSLEDLKKLQEVEHEVRAGLLNALVLFEMQFRARFSFALATGDPGPFGYLEELYYRPHVARRTGHEQRILLLSEIHNQLGHSRDLFITHYLDRGQSVPIWAAVEALSFGTLSKMFHLLALDSLRSQIAHMFGYSRIGEFSTVLHSLSVLRNVCAHGGRLWNRVLRVPPTTPANSDFSQFSTVARLEHLRRIAPCMGDSYRAALLRIDVALQESAEFEFGYYRPTLGSAA